MTMSPGPVGCFSCHHNLSANPGGVRQGGSCSLGSDEEEEAPSIVLATQGLPAAGSR